jgi:hypothetical protein
MALADSAKQYGDDFEAVHNACYDGVDYDVDVACLWGIMGNAAEIVSGYVNRNKHVVMFDKALFRHFGGEGGFRVGIDGPSPIKYLMRVPREFERFEKKRIPLSPKVMATSKNILRPSIIYCGSSQKYCDFYNLGDANDYAEDIFNKIRELVTKVSILYRPKPSWDGARDIKGSEMSRVNKSLKIELSRSRLLITHGSAAAVEAIVAGVPVITLGPCASQFVGNQTLDNNSLLDPYFPSEQARWQWLCNLAYCQWSGEEFQSGEAWGFIRNEILELDRKRS